MTPIVLLGLLLMISMCCEVLHASGTTFPIVLVICGLVVWGLTVATKGITHHKDDR